MSCQGTARIRQRVKARLKGELWVYSAQEMEEEWLRDIVHLCAYIEQMERGRKNSNKVDEWIAGERMSL